MIKMTDGGPGRRTPGAPPGDGKNKMGGSTSAPSMGDGAGRRGFDNWRIAFHGIAIAMAASSLLFLAIAISSPSLLDAFTDLGVAILSSLPAILGFLLARRYGIGTPFGRCFALLAAGSALWAIGECLWPIYTKILGEEMPFPSPMDALWMSGYAFMGLGIYAMLRIFGPIRGRGSAILASCSVAIASAIILIAAPKIYGSSPMELLIHDYYLISDVAILGLLFLAYQTFRGGRVSRAWLILIAGIAAILSADALFNLAVSIRSEGYLLLSDLIYMNGYSLMALGFAAHAMEL